MRIGLYLPNWVGDAVMATPAIKQLRVAQPEATLVGIGRPVIEQTLRGLPELDEFVVTTKAKSKWDQVKTYLRDAKLVREQSLDAIVLMTNSFRTAFVSKLAGVKQRVGFVRDGRSWLLTDRLQAADCKTPHSVVDDYLKLMAPLGASTERLSLQLTVDADAQQLWDGIRQEQGIGPQYIVMNTGGAFGPAKHWGDEKFAELAMGLSAERQLPVVLICGPTEAVNARNIVAIVNEQSPQVPIFSLADSPMSLGLSKAVVAGSEMMISTDSGPRHFAAAFNKPVISIYGPTHQAWSENGHALDLPVQHQVDCGPCQKRECPLGHHRCMNDLSAEVVLSQIQNRFLPQKAA